MKAGSQLDGVEQNERLWRTGCGAWLCANLTEHLNIFHVGKADKLNSFSHTELFPFLSPIRRLLARVRLQLQSQDSGRTRINNHQ